MKNMLRNIFFLLACTFAMNAYSQQRNFHLYAVMNGKTLMSTGDSTWIWGYGYYWGSITSPITQPGPLLTVYLGDTVNVTFKNLSGEMHTIHLHGTDVDQRNDGSEHTWPPVPQNDSTTYTWVVAHPGSYFYHCHVMTVHHLQMGMYGMIIAKNYPDTTKLWTGGPGFNKEYSYMMTDMDTMMHETPLSPGDLHSFEANYCMINGYADWMMFARPNQIIDAAPGDSICLHLGNLGYSTTRLTFPPGSNPTVYESDSRVLAQSFTCDTLRIYPGERYEVILHPTTLITGWIEVDYLNAVVDDSITTNYIGFNQYVHPTSVVANPITTSSFDLFPNPANHSFTIVSDLTQPMQIYTTEGRLVRSQLVSVGSNNIDCSGLASGIYVIRLGNVSKKLIIAAE